jgi:S1-C subfamily serine protease
MTKEFLSQKGVNYEERDVSRNPSYAQELVQNTRQMGVPVTVIGDQTVIGFDRDRLDKLLTRNLTSKRPSFGASITDASKITARQGSGITLGAFIGRLRPGSLAEKIGVAPGDIITELNEKRITNANDLESGLASLNKGSRFSLIFLRGAKSTTTEGVFN